MNEEYAGLVNFIFYAESKDYKTKENYMDVLAKYGFRNALGYISGRPELTIEELSDRDRFYGDAIVIDEKKEETFMFEFDDDEFIVRGLD